MLREGRIRALSGKFRVLLCALDLRFVHRTGQQASGELTLARVKRMESQPKHPIAPDRSVESEANDAVLRARELSAQCLGRFLLLVSHELSNPLQSLTMLVELAHEESGQLSVLHDRLAQGLQAAEEMRLVIRDLGEFASFSLSSEYATCSQVVLRALGPLRRRFSRHLISVKQDFSALDEVRCHSDIDALVVLHALLNVLSKAAAGSYARYELQLVAHHETTQSNVLRHALALCLDGIDVNGERTTVSLQTPPSGLDPAERLIAEQSISELGGESHNGDGERSRLRIWFTGVSQDEH